VLVADVRQPISAKATDVISAKTPDATAAKGTHVTSTKATHVASAKATHAPATVSSATAAAAGLCPRGKKAAGKHGACQNHHHSSSHDILHRDGRTFRHRSLTNAGVLRSRNANVAMDWRWKCRFVVSTKFPFNHPNLNVRRYLHKRRISSRALKRREKIGRRAPASFRGHKARRTPSARQPHDIASGDRRGCSEADLGLQGALHH